MRRGEISSEERTSLLMQLCNEHPDGVTSMFVASSLGWSQTIASSFLRKLHDDERLTRRNIGDRGNTYIYCPRQPVLPFVAFPVLQEAAEREMEDA